MRTARRLVVPLLVGLAMVAAACGGSDPGAAIGSDGSEDAAAGAGSAGDRTPVTIEHRYGTTELAETPTRIVSLDVQWTDVLLAMGTTPVGYIGDPSVPDGFPWRDDLLADSTEMTATNVLPYEQIAALDPDLIVVTYFAQDESDYQQLSAIAPTIATLSDRQVDTWQDITTAAGEVLGEPDTATEVIDGVDAQVAEVHDALPGLQGRTVAFVNYLPGDSLVVVSDPDDGAVVLFRELGMVISPEIVEAGDGASGRATLSLERVDLLDADLLLMLANGAETSSIPGYDQLPAVQHGAAEILDYATATALNTPTPLSIPYALEQLRPVLDAAAA